MDVPAFYDIWWALRAGFRGEQHHQSLAQFTESLLTQDLLPSLLHIDCSGTHHAQRLPTARRQFDESSAGIGGVGRSSDIAVPFQRYDALAYGLATALEPIGEIRCMQPAGSPRITARTAPRSLTA